MCFYQPPVRSRKLPTRASRKLLLLQLLLPLLLPQRPVPGPVAVVVVVEVFPEVTALR